MAVPYVCPLGLAIRAHSALLQVQGLWVQTGLLLLITPWCESLQHPISHPLKSSEQEAWLSPWLFLPMHLTLVMFAKLAWHQETLKTQLVVFLANPAHALACKPRSRSCLQSPPAAQQAAPRAGQAEPLLRAVPALQSAAGCTAPAPSSPGAAAALPSPLPQTVLGSLTN